MPHQWIAHLFHPKAPSRFLASGTLGWRTNSLCFGCISWAQLLLGLHQVTAQCIGLHLESTLGNSSWICDSGFPKSCWRLSFQRAGVGSESKWQVRFPWALFTWSSFESELTPTLTRKRYVHQTGKSPASKDHTPDFTRALEQTEHFLKAPKVYLHVEIAMVLSIILFSGGSKRQKTAAMKIYYFFQILKRMEMLTGPPAKSKEVVPHNPFSSQLSLTGMIPLAFMKLKYITFYINSTRDLDC